jgi:hypothetical protein
MSTDNRREFQQIEVGGVFFHGENKYRKIGDNAASLVTSESESDTVHLFYPEDAVLLPEEDVTEDG